MTSILLFDISNQHINIGVFEREEMCASWRVATRVDATPDEYGVLLRNLLRQRGIGPTELKHEFEGGVIASSVPPMVPTFQALCEQQFGWSPFVVTAGCPCGITIRTDNPREVGADRIANGVAAKTLYGVPAIVIDFSTVTVFDAINDAGEYIGSAIAPGLTVSADALFRATAQLLRVELAPPEPPGVIGKNSINSVRAGLIYGHASLVEGMIARMRREMGAAARVIATGEQLPLLAGQIRSLDVTDDYLTLQGLRLIYEMNH